MTAAPSPAAGSPLPVLVARGLSKIYGSGEVEVVALDDVSLEIARAVAKRPDVLLCDEPTGALDYPTGKLVLEVIARINRELGTTAVVITHNAAIAGMADRVLHLGGGRIQRVEQNARKLRPSELSW